MEEYELHKSRHTENRRYEKAYNRSSVHDINLKFIQEIDNFMSYNFGSQSKVRFQSKLVEKFNYYSSGFLVLQKIEPLYFAYISCCPRPFELKFGEHLDDKFWNNFGIQLMR